MITFKELREALSALWLDVESRLEAEAQRLEAENELASVATHGFAFVRAFSVIAQKLSEATGKTYSYYLEQAKELLSAGKHDADVLWLFDSMLSDITERRC